MNYQYWNLINYLYCQNLLHHMQRSYYNEAKNQKWNVQYTSFL